MTRALRHEWHTALYDLELRLSVTAKVVGGALLEYVGRDGAAWPSLAELGERTGYRSERTVQAGLRELEHVGLLDVRRREGQVNVYRLTLLSRDRDRPRSELRGSRAEPPQRPPQSPPQLIAPGTKGTSGTIETGVALERATACQELVAGYVDLLRANGSPAPRRLVGQVAKQVGELAREGIPGELIRRALELLFERRLNPAVLPSLIPEASAGPRAGEHIADRLYRQSLEEAGR